MDLSDQLPDFFEKFWIKVDQIYDYYIYVEDYIGLGILYNSLPDYWQKELADIYHDFGPNEPLWRFTVNLEARWPA
ncbi:hypothetical protein KY284_000937 [Solanum tuberosum]|nr:hypothetical protein KY284_000937 [Solanum tuberosum]